MARRRQPSSKTRFTARLSDAKLDRLIEEAVIDAYGDSEQTAGLFTMMEEHLEFPFQVEILGAEASVTGVDLTTSDEVVAVCARGKSRQRISVLELPAPTPRPPGWEWVEAYRRWCGDR